MEPDRKYNFFSQPAHLYTVTCITEILLIVTLSNQYSLTYQKGGSLRKICLVNISRLEHVQEYTKQLEESSDEEEEEDDDDMPMTLKGRGEGSDKLSVRIQSQYRVLNDNVHIAFGFFCVNLNLNIYTQL